MFRGTKQNPLPLFLTGFNLVVGMLLPIDDTGVILNIFEFVGVQNRCYMCQDKPGLCTRVASGFDWICPDCWWILQPAQIGYDYWCMELSEMSGSTISPFSSSEGFGHGTTLVRSEFEQDDTESIAP
jgi:hypothetical protein